MDINYFLISKLKNCTYALCTDRCWWREHARTNHNSFRRDYALPLEFYILRGYSLKVNYLQTEHDFEIFHLNLIIYYFFVIYGVTDKT